MLARFLYARVARPEESVGADDGEAHRVLVPSGNTQRFPLALPETEKSGVARDEQGTVGGVDTEAVHVQRARIRLGSI